MKIQRRNRTSFEYLPASGEETDLNEYGEHTGEYGPDYGTAVTYFGTISAPSGNVNQTFYGQDIRYTHVLIMDDPNVDIRENGLIRWKGHEYEIRAVLPTLNTLSVALRRVTSDAAQEQTVEPEPGEPDDPEEPDGDGE